MSREIENDLEAPYPLKQQFHKMVLPGLIFLCLGIGVLMGKGSVWLTEKIYLEISQNRSGIIDRALRDEDGSVWDRLQKTSDPKGVFSSLRGQHFLQTLRGEVKELGLSHLKIYGDEGLILYSSEETQIGTFDPSDGYEKAREGVRTLVEKKRPDGVKLYELYVQVPDSDHVTVMELYEPVDYLDGIALQVVIPAILVPVCVLILLGWVMNKLVFHAQADINYRTDLLSEFRTRLQQLVSEEAVVSLRSATGKGGVSSRRVRATILFSDVRGFTDFCEGETPETVVSFLNRSLGIVIDAVQEQGGDVDKMIGDAVLAHFQGPKAEACALKAAQAVMQQMKSADLPRGVGIGIYTGDVVVGTVGAANRMDFTVIGDTVNVASRFCSCAKEGEIIIDQDSFQCSGNASSPQIESLRVKGKEAVLPIIRL